MMYKFRIKGYATLEGKNSSYYCGFMPVDATVYASTLDDAIEKIKQVYGYYISSSGREVFIEEKPELW